MNEFVQEIDGYSVRVVEKEEESRAFFQILGKYVYPDGDKRKKPELVDRINREDEMNAATYARQWFESAYNVMFVRFGKDPMAGGLRPRTPVTEQVILTGTRHVRIKTAHSQEFPENQQILQAGGSVEVKGNASHDAVSMVNTPMWAGEW